MAGTSLLTLIDDIATVLDDVAVLTKVAAKKTAGVLGDDLALNAQQVTGVVPNRELPVVWAVAKGSAVNKLILVPAALLISSFLPWIVTPLLMLGGAFLCYEGFEKVMHKVLHHDGEEEEHEVMVAALADPDVDMVAFEREKVKGAIRTDFILSAEIIVIALGAVTDAAFVTRLGVLVGISTLMTVGVYGLVALIVKIDDIGLAMMKAEGESSGARLRRKLGAPLVSGAPYLMKGLGIVGTIAMFLVGGGIIAHGIGPVEEAIHSMAEASGALGVIVPTLLNGVVGVIAGGLVVAVVTAGKKVTGRA